MTLWCGDIFKIPHSAWKGCTSIYDRAAMVALPKEIRAQYAELIQKHIRENAAPQFRMLLITIEYDNPSIQGPPFSVSEAEVHALYGDHFNIQALSAEHDEDLLTRKKFENTEVTEKCYWISTKKSE